MPTKPPQHRPPHWRPAQPKTAWHRTDGKTTTERGYGADWRKLRARILKRDLWCQPCLAEGRHRQATQVDHKTPKAQGGTDDPSNLQGICYPCHKAKSSAEGNTR